MLTGARSEEPRASTAPVSHVPALRIKCRSMPANDATGSRARPARCQARSHLPFTRRAATFVLFIFLSAVTASAAAPNDSSTEKPSYTLTAWTGQGDLILGDVFAIAEDRDGYLWLGTSNGLVRFDGAVFTRRATGTPARAAEGPVSALLGARDGSLWVGGAGELVRMKTDGIAHFAPGTVPLPGSDRGASRRPDGNHLGRRARRRLRLPSRPLGACGGHAGTGRWDRLQHLRRPGWPVVVGHIKRGVRQRASRVRVDACRTDLRAGLRAGPPWPDVDHRHEGDDKTADHGRRADSPPWCPRTGGRLAHGSGSRRQPVGGGSRWRTAASRRRRLWSIRARTVSVRAQDLRIPEVDLFRP